MQLSDTHCHLDRLDLSPWNDDFAQFMQAARAHDLAWMLCVAIDLDSYPAMCDLVAPYPEIAISVGVHPNEEPQCSPTLEQLIELGRDARVLAIGETGLDYFRTEPMTAWQVERFRTHIEAARQVQKPLIIHTREAREDTLRVLEEAGARDCGGVMHCFVEDWASAKRARSPPDSLPTFVVALAPEKPKRPSCARTAPGLAPFICCVICSSGVSSPSSSST